MYGAIQKTEDGYEATYERILRHSPEKVWAAITDPDHIRQWFVRSEIDPRVGGRVVQHHDHVGLTVEGKVTRFEPPRAFEHTWFDHENGEDQHTSILWELHPHEDGCRLVMTWRFPTLDGIANPLAGWHICLDVLTAVLDGADPEDHNPPQGTFVDGNFSVQQPGTGLWAQREDLDDRYATIVAAQTTTLS